MSSEEKVHTIMVDTAYIDAILGPKVNSEDLLSTPLLPNNFLSDLQLPEDLFPEDATTEDATTEDEDIVIPSPPQLIRSMGTHHWDYGKMLLQRRRKKYQLVGTYWGINNTNTRNVWRFYLTRKNTHTSDVVEHTVNEFRNIHSTTHSKMLPYRSKRCKGHIKSKLYCSKRIRCMNKYAVYGPDYSNGLCWRHWVKKDYKEDQERYFKPWLSNGKDCSYIA